MNTDDELIRHYQAGDESAMAEIVHRHKKRVYSYILSAVREKHIAENIFQDTFFKVIRTLKRQQYNSEGKFIQWVVRIAHNLIIDHFRQSKKMPTVSKATNAEGKMTDIFDIIKVEEPSHEDFIMKNQIHKDIRLLIEELSSEQKEVVILRHYHEMSFKEIADATNVSINTALGRMRYALINLKRMAEERRMVLTD